MDLINGSDLITPRMSCARLRWNGVFMDVEPDLSMPNPKDSFCWCSLTHTCLGPDGRVADEVRCGEGRGCFETL